MVRILNGFLNIIKLLLLVACFVFTFFIIISMYNRLEKPLIGSIYNFIPYILLFILFSINLIFRQKQVTQNTFYNVVCIMVFLMLGFSIYRTFMDKNMIVLLRLGYDINFNYFADMIAPMRVLLYTLSLCNVLLIISGLDFEKKKIKKEEN